VTASQPGEIEVEDQLERRIRKPVDLLRCVLACTGIVALAVAGVAASATTSGAQTDIADASRRLPHALVVVAGPVALFALLVLPVAMAVQLLVRRQFRRLAEAVATGVLAAAVTAVASDLLTRPAVSRLYYAIIMARPGASHAAAFDPYLAGLVAYATMVGLAGRPYWRNALWAAIAVYAVVQVGASRTSVLSLLITVLGGRAIGLAVRYAAGAASQRPGALEIAGALGAAGLPVTAIRRVRGQEPRQGNPSRRYAVTTSNGDGGRLDVVVYDRDQQAAGAFYRLYRRVRVRGQVARSAPLSVGRAVQRRALLSYAAEEAGAPTPRLRAVVRAGPEAAVLACEHHDGTTLGRRSPGCSDAELDKIWDAVGRLHARKVTHRGLTADRILLTGDGQAMLLDPGGGDIAASDLQIRLDLAQLLAELALAAGPDRAAGLAVEKLSADDLVAVVSLLQPVALARPTRQALRRRRDVLPALRARLLAAVPGGEVTPARLERIRPRTLLTLVAAVAAVYLLAGELGQASLGTVLHKADWRWGLAALALSAATYAAAAEALIGFAPGRLSFRLTLLAQLASSFVTLVTPAAVGGATLNIRYLQRQKISAAAAAASVGVAQVVAFVLHALLILVFAAIAGSSASEPVHPPPRWAWLVLAGLVLIALVVLAIPAGRQMLRARLSPMLGQVLPRLLQVAQQPGKLARGIGGTLLLSFCYILCLAACVAAFSRSVPIAKIGLVYLTGSAIGSIIPTPGGLGAVEAALTAGLTAAGVPGPAAASAVLLFRLLTFWLPIPFGWAALKYLEREQAL
jgi:glycosyltransferase 2 family protein